VTPAIRRRVFLVGVAGMAALYLWGIAGLPHFGSYHGPYGFILDGITEPQTHATGVVSAINFFYRGFDTVGEEFILFAAATGVAVVLRELRKEHERPASEVASEVEVAPTSEGIRMVTLAFVGPTLLIGWWLTAHAQTDPSGGFQGGVVGATAFVLVYLAGQYVSLKRISPVDLTDAVEAVGAGGFAFVGLAGLATGAAYLSDVLPLGNQPGAVNSSGTIVLISYFVGLEVTAAFLLIVSELVEQTLLVRAGGST
jgi:multicomponent Na+:H+ antiporter subunit B